jgi:hypothetical protein
MSGANERPKGISESAFAVILFQLVGLVFVARAWTAPLYTLVLTANVSLAIVGVVAWFYWKGRNWARWLILFQAIFPSFLVLIRQSSNRPLAITVVDGMFGLFLLYWLNTKKVRAFFSHGSDDPS